MGDISAEPSMEDILSSIKRIIAEEGEGVVARPRRARAVATAPLNDAADDDATDYGADRTGEILELSDPMPAADPIPPRPIAKEPAVPAPAAAPTPAELPAAEPILSQQTAAASRGSLDTLSKLMTKPEPGSDGTLEGLVREMLRPMLRDWLDANLPDLVETLVAREIAKITGQGR